MTYSPSFRGTFLIHSAPRQVSDCPEGQGCPLGPFAPVLVFWKYL